MRKVAIVMLLNLMGCAVNSDKKVTLENFEFKTGDDTELFFKNVRQSYYDLEENEAAKFNLFRLSDRVINDTVPILNLAIVINYLQDEAYLFLEPNEVLSKYDPLTIQWKNTEEGTSGEFILASRNREGMLSYADKLYKGILAGYDFSLAGGQVFLGTQAELEAFRITVADYYRLTRLE
ncbi:MAG: hypothetical protein AAF519_20705 [Bacteroidota bacterium]